MSHVLAGGTPTAAGSSHISDVARFANVPSNSMHTYANKLRMPKTEILLKISEHTGLSLEWLLKGTGPVRSAEIGLPNLTEASQPALQSPSSPAPQPALSVEASHTASISPQIRSLNTVQVGQSLVLTIVIDLQPKD